MKKKIILDSITIEGNEVCLRDERNEFWAEYNKQSNINTEMYYNLYKSGELEKISDYCTSNIIDGAIIVDFIISTENLSEDFLNEMDRRFPGNSFRADTCTCNVTRTTGMSFLVKPTYRDNNGVISKRMEHPFVDRFSNEVCDTLAKMTPLEAAKEVIYLMWKDVDVA